MESLTDEAPTDLLPAGVAVADGHLRLMQINRELGALLGRDPERLLGRPLDELFAPASRVMLHNYLLPLLHLHGRVEEFAATLHAEGPHRPDVLLYAHWGDPRQGAPDDDRCLHLVMVRHRARRQVEDDLLRIQRAADQSPGVMFQLLENEGRLQFPFASEALRSLYSVSPAQARHDGRPVLRRVHPQDRRALMARTEQERPSGRCQIQMGLRVRQGPGQWRRHEVNASGRALEGGQWIWHGHVADVTERHELRSAIEQRNAAEQARQQQLTFLSRLSHELRTPLNAILGFNQLLQRRIDPPLDPAHREPVDMIGQAGRNLMRMVDDVLEVSRLQTGDFPIALQDVDALPLALECLKMHQPMADAAGVVLQPGPTLPGRLAVRADPNRLRQVLTNLVSNAIKFNRRGGRVRIELIRSPTELSLAVVDDGPGLSDAQLNQLFQPFNRLGAERSGVAGTGLGLVICRHLVEAMGGRIEVASEAGKGASFCVALPLAEASGTARDTQAASPAPAPARRLLGGLIHPPVASGDVLYVEDDRVNALLMAAVLGGRPQVRLRIANTAAEAVQAARQKAPDLLLLDRHLPDGDGMELLSQLRALPGMADVPAVMVSASALPEDIQRARELGFDGYWSKPLDVTATLADLDRRLAKPVGRN